MIDATRSLDHRSEARATEPIVDIAIVLAISALAYALEDLANARGWVSVPVEARGLSAVLAGALAAIGVIFARGGTLADLGFRRPERWARVAFQAALVLAAFGAAQTLLPLLVSRFVPMPEPDLSRYDSISGNLGAALGMALLLPLTASIPEEIIYRGFLVGRLVRCFGQTPSGVFVAVLVQALVFGAVHFMWGIGGVIVTVLMGVLWGGAYLMCGRNLWVVILAHSAGHVLFVAQLYLRTPIVP